MTHYHLLSRHIEDPEFKDYAVWSDKDRSIEVHNKNHELYPELFRLAWCNHEDCQVDAEDS